MAGKSSKTTILSIRLPNEAMLILNRRCSTNRYESVGDYLRARILYDLYRKHGKRKNKILKTT